MGQPGAAGARSAEHAALLSFYKHNDHGRHENVADRLRCALFGKLWASKLTVCHRTEPFLSLEFGVGNVNTADRQTQLVPTVQTLLALGRSLLLDCPRAGGMEPQRELQLAQAAEMLARAVFDFLTSCRQASCAFNEALHQAQAGAWLWRHVPHVLRSLGGLPARHWLRVVARTHLVARGGRRCRHLSHGIFPRQNTSLADRRP